MTYRTIKNFKTLIFFLSLIFISTAYAGQDNNSCFLGAYCGSNVLSKALHILKVNSSAADKVIENLNAQADQNKGINSLYQIKLASQKLNLNTLAFKPPSLDALKALLKEGQLIANITGNRHFCLIQGIENDSVDTYIPGLNQTQVKMPFSLFKDTWDGVILLVSKKPVNLAKYKAVYASVSDENLKNILGGQPCNNCSGNGWTANGSGGAVRGASGNESGESNSGSSTARQDPSTKEPVIIRNGNLFLTVDDINIPTRSALVLNLKRHYNAQVISEVPGWLPEPGAGSWVIENGEYSAQGNRSTSELKLKNFTLELDTQTIQPGSNYAWETGWVNFRYTEKPNDPSKAYNCYYFIMHTDGKIELSKWQNGTQYFLYNKASSYRPTNKNRIKIEAQASNIKIYINGALAINYTDPSPLLAEGRIALESYFSHSHFDNIKITSGAQTYNYDFNTDDNEFIFGYGWTHSYSLRIKEYPNHVTLYRENNHKEIYVPNGDGTYFSAPVNYYSKLTKNAGGFSLKDKFGTYYRFNLSGKLQYIEDRNLNRTTLTYSTINGKTLLTSITEPAGRKITLEYGAHNMVAKTIDPAGNYLQYFYDANNHLIKALDHNGNTTSYTYDLITHNLKELKDPVGNTYKYNYTYNDRVNGQIDPLGNTTTFDYLWSTVHVINKRGEIYKYNFDNNEFLQSITNPQNVMERTTNDANGNITNYYDKNGSHTYFTYDSQGNKTGIYDANSKWTKFTYEAAYNQLTSITDAKGNVANFSYDAKGNLLQTVNAEGNTDTYTYNSFGQLLSLADAKNNITKLSYDTYGNLASRTDAQGNVTGYSYNILGQLTKLTDAAGNITEYAYEKNGNLLSTKDALGNITAYAYNKNDELISITDPLGNTTNYSYDCFGNLFKTTDAAGNITSYSYDTANQMHRDIANLLTVTDSKGNKTTYNYDSLDKLIKTTDAQNNIYQFSYDKQGNLISRIDANAITTGYQYDVLNRLYRINYPDGKSVNYAFDAAGNITQTQDLTGTYNYTYDKVNRLKSQSYPDSINLNYAYDPNGNRASLEITGLGKTSYNYDSLNRLAKITLPNSKITQFSYDKLSRKTQLIYPNGAITNYNYDNASRLSQLLNKSKAGVDISKFSYTYDKASRRTSINLINGSANYAYDKINQLTNENGAINSQNFALTYTYDAIGNRLSLNEAGQISNYTYNNLNQLIQTSGASQKLIQVKGNVSDANPVTVKVNGISATIASGQFTANNISLNPGSNTIKAEAIDAVGNVNSHQISVTYNSPNAAATTYTYNKNGNLTQRKVGTTTENFSYDYDNRLKSYTSPTQAATYTYDGQGRRISKTVNGTITKYYYDGDEIILEKAGSNSIYYIHGPRVDEIIWDSRGYCYQSDGLGSTANLTDAGGNKVNSYDYKAFGQIRNQSGTAANPWLFTGRQLDPESGLYFYRNRYYDSRVGRFTTRDPIGYAGGINLYAYCSNNPINANDPFGLDTYYVNYELITSNHKPTQGVVSHSYPVLTDNGIVTDTFSYGNKSQGKWFHNDPQDMRIAQEAINSRVGATWQGNESLDPYVVSEYEKVKDSKSLYFIFVNDCKVNGIELIKEAKKAKEEKCKK